MNRAARQAEHAVYLHRDAEGCVIYVGCSADVETRHRAHRRASAHWPLVAEVIIDSWQPTYTAGRLREAELIHEHQPRYNMNWPLVSDWENRRNRELLPRAYSERSS